MSEEEIFEEYKKNPKWKGKIFMQDEKTCFIDGFKMAVDKLKNCYNCINRDEDMYGRKICKLDDLPSYRTTCHNFDHWQLK